MCLKFLLFMVVNLKKIKLVSNNNDIYINTGNL